MRCVRIAAFTLIAGITALLPSLASACPFCSAASQTFSEEMESMNAVVFAEMSEEPESVKSTLPSDSDPTGEFNVTKAKFRITKILKGKELISGGVGSVFETIYFGDGKKGDLFLAMAVEPPNLAWNTPLKVSPAAANYISKLPDLPEAGAERLVFFQDYLENEDELLARDAYDEFANASYDEVKALKPHIDHDQLMKWIESKDVPASRRRLYFTMLGVAGTDADLPVLEKMLKATDRKTKAGLDAMIAAYLTIRGPSGVKLIEEQFISKKDAQYADTYAAIMALRFHGSEADIIPKDRVLEALRLMLDRPQLADLVIPDLARWEDWTVIDRLVDLFIKADDKSSWVRVPVINYLRACPLPEAEVKIKELEKIDPAAVKRARTFFPFTPSEDEASSNWTREGSKIAAAKVELPRIEISDEQLNELEQGEAVAQTEDVDIARQSPISGQAIVEKPATMNIFAAAGVPIMASLALFATFWLVLKGGFSA